jgi:WD40 repeat protein
MEGDRFTSSQRVKSMRRIILLLLCVVMAEAGCGRKAPSPAIPDDPAIAGEPPAPKPVLPEPRERPHRGRPPLVDLPEPEAAVTDAPFKVPANGEPKLSEPRAQEVIPPPAATVSTITPSQRLGDRKHNGPGVLAPLAASEDGSTLAFTTGMSVNHGGAGWQGQAIVVWETLPGREIRHHKLTELPPTQLALSPTGQRLYAGSHDRFRQNKLRVWDVRTGECLRERPTSLWALTPDGKTLATFDIHVGTIDPGFDDNPFVPWRSTLTVWDATDFTQKRSFTYTSFVPHSLAVSADGSKVVCGRGSIVTAFDTITGKPLWKQEFEGKSIEGFVPGRLTFSPDGKSVTVGDTAQYPNPRKVHLLDLADGKSRVLVSRGDLDHGNQPPLVGMAFTPDSGKLVVAFQDAVVIADVATGELPPARGPTRDLDGWKKSRQLGHPAWWEFFRRGIQPDDLEHLYGFALSGDGKTAFLGGRFMHDGCMLRVLDVATREIRFPAKSLEAIKPPFPTADPFPVAHDSHVPVCPNWMKLPGGQELRFISYFAKLELNGKQVGPDEMLGYVVTPDGETLVTRGRLARVKDTFPDDPRMRFRDVATGKEWGDVPGPEWGQIWARRAMALSPDGRTLAALQPDGCIWLWEVATLKPRLRLDRAGHEDIFRFAFSRDGRHLMSNDYHARTGLVWDLPGSGKPAKLTERELSSLWDDLKSDDAAKAYQAIGNFATDPASAVPFLAERCGQLAIVTEQARLAARPFDKDVVNARRAVEALERCGTADAAKALADLAKRFPYAGPAAAVERLSQKGP